MPFVIRKFENAQSLGQMLKTARKAANLTLGQMAEITKIRKCYLDALEKENHHRLPEPLYTRNFLKTYVNALGQNEHYFLNRFEEERGTCDLIKNAQLPLRRARAVQFLVASRFVKFTAFAVISLAVLSYIGYQIRAITVPPEIFVSEPTDGLSTKEAAIEVIGQVGADVKVQINGTEVLLSKDGTFENEVALKRGLNIISIEARRRYSKPMKIYRRVVLEQDENILGISR
ncbi:helix-turn-helix domain-containing protein [Patescibacteria group bacterium]